MSGGHSIDYLSLDGISGPVSDEDKEKLKRAAAEEEKRAEDSGRKFDEQMEKDGNKHVMLALKNARIIVQQETKVVPQPLADSVLRVAYLLLYSYGRFRYEHR